MLSIGDISFKKQEFHLNDYMLSRATKTPMVTAHLSANLAAIRCGVLKDNNF